MNDTSPRADREYRELLLRKSGQERLRMGCSMHATARAFVVASILAKDPNISAGALRQAIFARFYAADFDAVSRQRILVALADDRPAARRRIPVDIDALELVLTSHDPEWRSYLDLNTGDVHVVSSQGGDGLALGTLLEIDPLRSSLEWHWMSEFAASVEEPRLRERLCAALEGRGPFGRFKRALGDHPDERARWFAVRERRLRDAAREWLARHGIEATPRPAPEGHK